MDRKHLWRLNSPAQNDHLIWELIKDNRHSDIKEMLGDGFPLSAFVLNEMHYHSWLLCELKDVLSVATVINDDVKVWITEYFDMQDISDLLLAKPELATEEFPSNKDCVKYKLWDVLLFRKEHSVIAKNAPEFLEKQDSLEACVALLQVNFDKYASLVWDKKFYNAFLCVKDGWKYLIDHGVVKTLLEKDCGELLPQAEIVEYCLQKGLIDELYEARKYNELLEHGHYEVFVKNHSFNSQFLEKYPEHVDWEDLWKMAESKAGRKYLINEAFKHPEVEQCNDFLWNHGGGWTRWCLLTGM